MTAEQIVKELGIEDSSDTFKARVVTKILATADLRFARIVDEIMNDEERQEFQNFSKGKMPQEVNRWVEETYEGIGEWYDEVVQSIVMGIKRGNP